jgi:hypothetical protein
LDHLRVFVTADLVTGARVDQSAVYACRHCRDAVKVAGERYLPEACPSCDASTWDEEGRCVNWERCTAVRRPGIRGRAQCHSCGHTVWVLVGVYESPRLGSGTGRSGP